MCLELAEEEDVTGVNLASTGSVEKMKLEDRHDVKSGEALEILEEERTRRTPVGCSGREHVQRQVQIQVQLQVQLFEFRFRNGQFSDTAGRDSKLVSAFVLRIATRMD